MKEFRRGTFGSKWDLRRISPLGKGSNGGTPRRKFPPFSICTLNIKSFFPSLMPLKHPCTSISAIQHLLSQISIGIYIPIYNCYIYAITPRIRIRIATGSGCYNVLKYICVNRFFKTYILFSESNPSRKGANFSYGLGYLNPMKCHINFHCQSHRKINLSSDGTQYSTYGQCMSG
jgi:hypothetical protein